MSSFLRMNGTTDYLKLPSMTLSKIVAKVAVRRKIDINRVIWDFRTGISFSYLQQTTTGTDAWGAGSIKVDGISKTNNTTVIPDGAICTIEHSFSSASPDDGDIFKNGLGNSNYIDGDIYDIQIFTGRKQPDPYLPFS